MLCYVMLCYVMLCYVMLCYVMLLVKHLVKHLVKKHLHPFGDINERHEVINRNTYKVNLLWIGTTQPTRLSDYKHKH